MKTIRVRYHFEPEGWWADSPDLDGFTAAGADLTEVRAMVKEGVPIFLDGEDVELAEELSDSHGPVVDVHVTVTGAVVPVPTTGYTPLREHAERTPRMPTGLLVVA